MSKPRMPAAKARLDRLAKDPEALTSTQTFAETQAQTPTQAEAPTPTQAQTETVASTQANPQTWTEAQPNAETDVFANVRKAVGQNKPRFEEIRKRQTYWQTDEDIEAVEELHKVTGLPKYQVVSEAIQAMRRAVLGDK